VKLKRLLIIVCFILVPDLGMSNGSQKDCPELIYGDNTISIFLYASGNCDCIRKQFGQGFLISWSDSGQFNEILWGGSDEAYTSEHYLFNLDGSGPPEVLTLFLDESNAWGFIHRLTLNSANRPCLQTLPVPVFALTAHAARTGSIYQLVGKSMILFEAIRPSHDSIAVYYDVESDSLALH